MASDPMTKLENAVRKLAANMAALRKEMGDDFGDVRTDAKALRAEVSEFKDGTLEALANIQQTQSALTSAMTQAIKEMAVSKSFEVRLSRLEAEVFGSKH